jgi:hypothetical protein
MYFCTIVAVSYAGMGAHDCVHGLLSHVGACVSCCDCTMETADACAGHVRTCACMLQLVAAFWRYGDRCGATSLQ